MQLSTLSFVGCVLKACFGCLVGSWVCLCVCVLTVYSRLAESRSRLSAASPGVGPMELPTLSFVGCVLKASFGRLVWFLGMPLCLCTDCVFKVGRVSITSVSCLPWGLELPTLSFVGCVLKASFGRLVWFLGLPLCLCTDCVFSFISYNRINHFSTTGLLRCDDCVPSAYSGIQQLSQPQ